MIKLLLSCIFIATTSYFFSQNFAYSFSGTMTVEQQNELVKNILEIPTISTCELRYKSDSNRGEILFYIFEPTVRSDSSTEFSPSTVKSLFISKELEPLDFRKIK